jgi:hypothetical protein
VNPDGPHIAEDIYNEIVYELDIIAAAHAGIDICPPDFTKGIRFAVEYVKAMRDADPR